ncbi:unnamed protein product [Amoebophrya sp. A25]|nr:unnamed protein product [Amoebophrya sp. A25]|eukprot:GSA25T00017529001.1
MVQEREKGGKMKTGDRKRRRDGGRSEHVEYHDVRNLEKGVAKMKVGEEEEESSEEESEAAGAGMESSRQEQGSLDGGFSDDEQDIPQQSNSTKREQKQAEDEEQEAEEKRAEDMARLADIKKKREEDKEKRLAAEAAAKEAEAKQAAEKAEKQKKDTAANEAKHAPLREALAKLIQVDASRNINQLNQDADAKKALKPLLKKAEIKALNKATLTAICNGDKRFKVDEVDKIVHCKRVA